jgi:DNA-binding NtrC family response regulator
VRVLIIDDERPVLLTIEALLKRRGFAVEVAATAAAGLDLIRKTKPRLVLLDLGLPDGDGMEVLRRVRQEEPEMEVLVLTANDSLANAIECIKLGAFHFIGKPYAPEELLNLIAQALEHQRLRNETVQLREQSARLERRLQEAEARLQPVYQSRSMRQLDELIRRVGPTDANVLIVGESGVGKEVLATRLHELSARKGRPMVRLNCAAFPAHMIEAELFGYAKGAFTGAHAAFPGMIREAAGGTLFLDEVAEMPPDLQTRFLRLLQEREYRPLGSTRTLKADFRLVAATNRGLREALQSGALRQDFYYRLNTFQLLIPPLRERREDIPALVQSFCSQFASRHGVPVPVVDPEVMALLLAYPWPGNIRELQNSMEYAVILASEGRIGLEQLPVGLRFPEASAGPGEPNRGLSLEEQERRTIYRVLGETQGNKKRAAEILGIQRATLYAKLRKYGMESAGAPSA